MALTFVDSCYIPPLLYECLFTHVLPIIANARFLSFGGAVPYRPVEDLAFAVARFFQLGGTFQNYYMVCRFLS